MEMLVCQDQDTMVCQELEAGRRCHEQLKGRVGTMPAVGRFTCPGSMGGVVVEIVVVSTGFTAVAFRADGDGDMMASGGDLSKYLGT